MDFNKDKQTCKIKKHRFRNCMFIFAALAVFLTGAFFLYTGNYYHAQPEAVSVFAASKSVEITDTEDGYIFSPVGLKADTAFIFYPGAKVEASAYSGLMQKTAENGAICILVKMPFNLAVLDSGAAGDIMNTYTDIQHWYIGGHSLGGAMAADFAAKNDEDVEGLILLGAYPAADLTKSRFRVLSIYGSQDQIMNIEKYRDGLLKMPDNHEEFVIEGGNHAQFGSYGIQKGDGEAAIDAGEQQKQTVGKIVEFMKS